MADAFIHGGYSQINDELRWDVNLVVFIGTNNKFMIICIIFHIELQSPWGVIP